MESKLNKGVMFKNLKKLTEKHPDYNGSINIDGRDVKFSGWINTSSKGFKYISLSVNTFKPEDKSQEKSVYEKNSYEEIEEIF